MSETPKENGAWRLEAHLERMIESAFAHLFRGAVRPQEIALQLSRAMEMGLETPSQNDPRPIAPDVYLIRLHPEVCEHLLDRKPDLSQIFANHLVELAAHLGYRLLEMPQVTLLSDPTLARNQVHVIADHSAQRRHATAVMQRVDAPNDAPAPRHPLVVINGIYTVELHDPLVTIGRSRDNHIVLEDPHASRHHAQLRLRFGSYTLFDMDSQVGTLVNDVPVREHRLQPGDVIRIGRTRLLYLEDEPPADYPTGTLTL